MKFLKNVLIMVTTLAAGLLVIVCIALVKHAAGCV